MTSTVLSERLATLTRSANTAMVVVTGSTDSGRGGCLVGFHGQTSIEPLRWGVWVSTVNHSYPIIVESEVVVVHFLTRQQHRIAEHFGALSGDDVDKFAGVALADAVSGTPVLAECEHRLVGRRTEVLSGHGDHSCVVLEPMVIESPGRFDPLRYDDVLDLTPGHPLH